MKKIITGILFLLIIFGLNSVMAKKKILIAIQPLGPVNLDVINIVKNEIISAYNADVTLLPEKSLPSKAYYKPRKRYRASKILDYLDNISDNNKKFTKIIGLTTKDISTTKGKYFDWGILGLGIVWGKPCVVSTFRLKKGNISHKKFLERLKKVAVHELGHTFGLLHCPDKKCIMQDAKGTVKTVDKEGNTFCPACRNKLEKALK